MAITTTPVAAERYNLTIITLTAYKSLLMMSIRVFLLIRRHASLYRTPFISLLRFGSIKRPQKCLRVGRGARQRVK